uniref:Uncharacterized protein n=1 Tax=Anguilla anguilla TaxID=7936 RepID=A0A0E9WQE4_ANGAN
MWSSLSGILPHTRMVIVNKCVRITHPLFQLPFNDDDGSTQYSIFIFPQRSQEKSWLTPFKVKY